MPPTADIGASLLDAELVLPRLREADPDEDAVTLAAEAALPVLERTTLRPDALVLATTEPPYDEGGNVQPLAELLGLAGPLVAFELTATDRDGLAALRLAAALVANGSSALVCASGRRGAVSLLLADRGGVARVVPLAANHMAHLQDITDRAIRRLARRLQPETVAHLCTVMTADAFARLTKNSE